MYNPTGGVVSRSFQSVVNRGGVMFNGFSTVESGGTAETLIEPVRTRGTLFSYNNIEGTDYLQYGVKSLFGGVEVTTSYNPPLRFELSPALNLPGVQTVTRTTQTQVGAAAPTTSTATFSITRVGLALETITVPVGVVSVCRSNVDTVDAGVATEQTQFTLATGPCKGQVARLVDRRTGTTIFEMTSATSAGLSCAP